MHLRSGSLSGNTVYSYILAHKGATFLRLVFGDTHLDDGAYIRIVSAKDGAAQELTAAGIERWKNKSAIFNGSQVTIELVLRPGNENSYLTLAGYMAGLRNSGRFGDNSPSSEFIPIASRLSGTVGVDDRVSSDRAGVFRNFYDWGSGIYSVDGTSWTAANGGHITAGHLNPNAISLIEANVPSSEDDGTPVFADPEDQFPLTPGTYVWEYTVAPNDWAVFETDANSAGRLAESTAGAFFRVTDDTPDVNDPIINYGYGRDSTPVGTTDCQNSDTQTLQQGEGYFHSTFGTGLLIVVIHDFRGGNSGGPVVDLSSGTAFGIQVAGTNIDEEVCDYFDGNQVEHTAYRFWAGWATPLSEADLTAELSEIPGGSVTHVDAGHPASSEDGSIYRPYASISEGVSNADEGDVLSIVAGSYSESITINKALILEAPVGTVTIDPTLSPRISAPQITDRGQIQVEKGRPQTLSRISVYPNPFNPEARVSFNTRDVGHASVAVYDALGRLVQVLFDGELGAGPHTFRIAASGLATGIYYYRIQSGDAVASGSLVLMR